MPDHAPKGNAITIETGVRESANTAEGRTITITSDGNQHITDHVTDKQIGVSSAVSYDKDKDGNISNVHSHNGQGGGKR